MARKATLTFSLSTDARVAHIGPWFADFRVNGRQHTRVGTDEMMRAFLAEVQEVCARFETELTVTNDTLGVLQLS